MATMPSQTWSILPPPTLPQYDEIPNINKDQLVVRTLASSDEFRDMARSTSFGIVCHHPLCAEYLEREIVRVTPHQDLGMHLFCRLCCLNLSVTAQKSKMKAKFLVVIRTDYATRYELSPGVYPLGNDHFIPTLYLPAKDGTYTDHIDLVGMGKRARELKATKAKEAAQDEPRPAVALKKHKDVAAEIIIPPISGLAVMPRMASYFDTGSLPPPMGGGDHVRGVAAQLLAQPASGPFESTPSRKRARGLEIQDPQHHMADGINIVPTASSAVSAKRLRAARSQAELRGAAAAGSVIPQSLATSAAGIAQFSSYASSAGPQFHQNGAPTFSPYSIPVNSAVNGSLFGGPQNTLSVVDQGPATYSQPVAPSSSDQFDGYTFGFHNTLTMQSFFGLQNTLGVTQPGTTDPYLLQLRGQITDTTNQQANMLQVPEPTWAAIMEQTPAITLPAAAAPTNVQQAPRPAPLAEMAPAHAQSDNPAPGSPSIWLPSLPIESEYDMAATSENNGASLVTTDPPAQTAVPEHSPESPPDAMTAPASLAEDPTTHSPERAETDTTVPGSSELAVFPLVGTRHAAESLMDRLGDPFQPMPESYAVDIFQQMMDDGSYPLPSDFFESGVSEEMASI